MTEGLNYHLKNNIPLIDSIFRYGSKAHFNLINEIRGLHTEGKIELSIDDKMLLETDLGNFGMYEGEEVPLDMPMVEPEWPDEVSSIYGEYVFKLDKVMPDRAKYKVIDTKTGEEEIGGRVYNTPDQLQNAADNLIKPRGATQSTQLGEAEFKGKEVPLNKPKRGGSKAYYVYVKDPKTKKVKKVSFGSGGLRAKIKNKQARNAFAKRHKCSTKKDRTKAGYWSCNLPRYASMLGLGSNMNTFW